MIIGKKQDKREEGIIGYYRQFNTREREKIFKRKNKICKKNQEIGIKNTHKRNEIENNNRREELEEDGEKTEINILEKLLNYIAGKLREFKEREKRGKEEYYYETTQREGENMLRRNYFVS